MKTLELKQVSVEDLQDGEYYLVYFEGGCYEVAFYNDAKGTMNNNEEESYFKCSSDIYYHLPY